MLLSSSCSLGPVVQVSQLEVPRKRWPELEPEPWSRVVFVEWADAVWSYR